MSWTTPGQGYLKMWNEAGDLQEAVTIEWAQTNNDNPQRFETEYKAQKINEMPISQVLAGVRPLSEGYEEIRAVKANGEGEKYIKIPSIEL